MIEPKYEILADLLERKLFRVPSYQRPYSWTTKQREDLFNDIKILSECTDTSRHHFMATIVCLDRKQTETVGADQYTTLEVVDGQQRLTTLVILLKAIEKAIHDKKIRAELITLLLKADRRLILLQISHDSNEVFRKYLTSGTIPNFDQLNTEAESNLAQAFRDCEFFVSTWAKTHKDGLIDLLRLLRYRIGFVYYTLDDESSVYTIFSALNSRGLDVDWIDKTKSMLMGIVFEKFPKKASEEHLKTLHEIWTRIYEKLGKKTIPGQEILRFAATLKYDKATSKTMGAEESYNFFNSYCTKDYSHIVETCDWLHDIADHLHNLYTNSSLSAVTDIAHARLLAIAIQQSSLKDIERQDLLEYWEKMTFKIFGLLGKDARHGVGDYVRLSRDIHQRKLKTKDQILEQMRGISNTYSIDEALRQITNTNCYDNWENDLKYFFYRYEEYLCQKAGRTIANTVWIQIWNNSAITSIEHICPQTPTAEWKTKFPGKSGVRNNVHRIGNLTLLPPNENSRIGQKTFADKKTAYKKYGLLMLEEIAAEKDWDKLAVDRRESKLIAWAKQTWE